MSQTQQLNSCKDNGNIPISYEHNGKISQKLSCQECIDFIKSSSTFKIISESKEEKS